MNSNHEVKDKSAGLPIRKPKIDNNFLERRVRMQNILYALQLKLPLGKTQEERFRTIAQYQAQSNLPKARWLY